MWPEADRLDAFLGRIRLRLALLFVMRGLAAGMIVAAALLLAGATSRTAVLTIVGLTTVVSALLGDERRWGWWRSLANVARRVERKTTVGHNLIVTAAELPRHARSYVHDVVMKRALATAATIDRRGLFPAGQHALLLAIAAAFLALVLLRPASVVSVSERSLDSQEPLVVRGLTVTITPPEYSGLPTETLQDPSVIEALANSTIGIRVDANAANVRLETLAGTRDLTFNAGQFETRLTAQADGFLALEPRDSAGQAGPRRLVGLSVRDDRPPRVTLAAPGRDLFFSNVPGALDVAITADDDLALDSLVLRYTAVSGSGERFTFVERNVSLPVTATNPRSWSARGRWALDRLGLEPGDLVVYRAVARDRRPGAGPVESESYVIEVVTPGAIASEGFAADDQRDRYAVSQQMVILKTERLIARRGSVPADSVSEEARLLAAEQRQVRAEFVFMMGGELEDAAQETSGTLELNEVAEAEAEDDILAGRLANQGRVEMMRAIRAMSRAAALLNDGDLDRALRDERTALDNLMRAFARSRFILRALTQRERIDLERRLSGSLVAATGSSAPASVASEDPRAASLRTLLAAVATWSTFDTTITRARVSDAALAVVRADPGSTEIRQFAARVQGLLQAPAPAGVDSVVRQAATMLAGLLPLAPNVSPNLASDAIAGQLRDVKRRMGVQP